MHTALVPDSIEVGSEFLKAEIYQITNTFLYVLLLPTNGISSQKFSDEHIPA